MMSGRHPVWPIHLRPIAVKYYASSKDQCRPTSCNHPRLFGLTFIGSTCVPSSCSHTVLTRKCETPIGVIGDGCGEMHVRP